MWDPACAADAMEMSFQGFDTETLISSLDASKMSLPSLFVIGTSSGKVFTPSTEMNPVQVLQEEISYMIPLLSSNKILMASKSCGNMVLVNRNQDNLFVDQCLSKHFDSLDGLKVSNDETIIGKRKF